MGLAKAIRSISFQMTDDLPLLIDRLRFLVDHPGDELGAIEHTLTDGYARALALEAERRRAEAACASWLGMDALAEQRILKVRLEQIDAELAELRGPARLARRDAEDARLLAREAGIAGQGDTSSPDRR